MLFNSLAIAKKYKSYPPISNAKKTGASHICKNIFFLFPISYFLFPISYFLFPISCSLFPVPCSLFLKRDKFLALFKIGMYQKKLYLSNLRNGIYFYLLLLFEYMNCTLFVLSLDHNSFRTS